MNTTTLVWIGLIVGIALIAAGLFMATSKNSSQRTKKLQEKFGPEYQHIVNERGDQRLAENELAARLKHVESLDIRPLLAEEVESFTDDWRATQVEFVDEPLASVQSADRLISQALRAKGYPVEDFEQGVADVSVSYPDLVLDYRELHLIASMDGAEIFGTEEMRKAMLRGRALFDNLMKSDAPGTVILKVEKESVL